MISSKIPNTLVQLFDGHGASIHLWVDLALADSWAVSISHKGPPHERLYCTLRGVWFVCRWTPYDEDSARYVVLTQRNAAHWMARNGHDLPQDLQRAFDSLDRETLRRLRDEDNNE